MNLWHIVTIIALLLFGFWLGQTQPGLLMGYPAKVFG